MTEDSPDKTQIPAADATQVIDIASPFPGYELLGELGKGGMATVYLAKDIALDRLVAIKALSESLATEDYLKRFDIEAKTAAGLSHPGIVSVYASGIVHSSPYIAFEYVAGGNLSQRLENGELNPSESVELIAKVADALAYLHSKGVVHRDVKPANILVNEQGQPALTDFGIARVIDRDAQLTQVGAVIGTPRYMSPEQLRGAEVTDKSDVYSLALVLVETLGGELPEAGELLTSASSVNTHKQLLLDCWAERPEDRPSATEFAHRLREGQKAPRSSSGRLLTVAALLFMGAALSYLTYQNMRPAVIGLQVEPAFASVYVAGEVLVEPELVWQGSPLELTAVATGFQGKALQITESQDQPVAIQLPPLGVPTAAQFQAFHLRFDRDNTAQNTAQDTAAQDTAAALQVGYPLYDRLIAYLVMQTDQPARATELLRQLTMLANQGDASSQVALFLLATENYVALDNAGAWVEKASVDHGFALATYYRALLVKQAVDDSGALSRAQQQRLRELLSTAARQGMALAEQELQLLNNNF